MGALAQALKRKLGGAPANGHHKRPCGAADALLPAAATEEADDPSAALRRQLANGGFAALIASHSSKNTRTALRKKRKAEQLARQQAQEEARRQQQRAEQRQQRGGNAPGTDSEDEEADGAGGAAAAALAVDGQGERGQAGAYGTLLSSLRAAGGAHAGALLQRQREQAGDSDASSDEGSEQGSEEEEAGSEEEEAAGSEEEEEQGEGAESEAGTSVSGSGALGDEESEGVEGRDEEGAEANGHAGSGSDDDGSSSDGDGAAQPAAAARRRVAGDGDGPAPSIAAAGPEDHYLAHFDAQLDEARAAELAGEAGRGRYVDCAAAGGGGGEQGPAVASDVAAQWREAGAALQALPGTRLPQHAPGDLGAYGVKERLAARWREVAPPRGGGDFADGAQRALFALLSSYCDLLLPCRPYPSDADAPDPQLDAVLLHALAHCARAADRIRKNNERLRGQGAAAPHPDAVPKDQGFTRAKVLLLLPQRNLALRAVRRLVQLAVRETRTDSVQGRQRLEDEFGDGGVADALSAREAAAVARKPAEHRALFAGNADDHFRLGVKLTRGAVKLFADFFDSDVIVASPLALATRLAEGGGEAGGAADFLSSVELVVVERADVLLMQNWAHVATVFDALNRIPREAHGVDMMRVRDWALSGRAALYRQTVLLSSFASPEMNALLARRCRNWAGCARLAPVQRGVLGEVVPQARQVFERLPRGVGARADADARFERFATALWPRIREGSGSGGQLIYVPSYFDYVRVRNFLRAQAAPFLGLCEYTERADAARARAYFFDRRKQVLLYTERAQFYNRHRIRGARAILFYQLPEHARFYADLVNLLEEGEAGETPTVTVMFSAVDALRLERVVGSARSAKMLKSRKTGTFLFC